MNTVQFDGFVEGISPNPIASTSTVRIVTPLKFVQTADLERLGNWRRQDEPEVTLVISIPSRPALEFDGLLVAARTDLGEHKLIIGVKIDRADVSRDDEDILADLGRFRRRVAIEINNPQLELPIGGD